MDSGVQPVPITAAAKTASEGGLGSDFLVLGMIVFHPVTAVYE
jgi:hypothetical protein